MLGTPYYNDAPLSIRQVDVIQFSTLMYSKLFRKCIYFSEIQTHSILFSRVCTCLNCKVANLVIGSSREFVTSRFYDTCCLRPMFLVVRLYFLQSLSENLFPAPVRQAIMERVKQSGVIKEAATTL